MSFEDELRKFEDLDQCYLMSGWPIAGWRVGIVRKTTAGAWVFRSADAGGSFLGTQLTLVGEGSYNTSETPGQGMYLTWWWPVNAAIGNISAQLQSRYPQEALG